jgi:tetratricopeptide (TPR) repeat protein
LGILLLVSIICGVTGVIWQWRQAVTNLNDSRAHEKLARRRLVQAQELLVRLSWAVDESFLWNESGYTSAFEFRPELQHEVERYVEEQPSDLSPSLTATTQWRSAYRDYEAGRREAGEAACRNSLRSWRQLVHEQPQNRQYRRSLALVLYYHTIYRISFGDEAVALVDLSKRPGLEGFSYANETDVQVAAEFAGMLFQRARALDQASHALSAANTYELAATAYMHVARAQPANPEHRFLATESYRSMGAACELAGLRDKSRTAYETAERVFPGTGGSLAFRQRCNVKLAEILSALGRVCVNLGLTSEGLNTLERAAKLWCEIVAANPEDPGYLQRASETSWQLATYRRRHDPSKAPAADWERYRLLFEDLRNNKKLTPRQWVRLADANRHLAKSRIAASDTAAAIACLREATECYRAARLNRSQPQNILHYADCLLLLGDQQRALGQVDAAQAAYREARKLFERIVQSDRILAPAQEGLRALGLRMAEPSAAAIVIVPPG